MYINLNCILLNKKKKFTFIVAIDSPTIYTANGITGHILSKLQVIYNIK